jgi:hypothetical protein
VPPVEPRKPFYKRQIKHTLLDCRRALDGDKEYIAGKEFTMSTSMQDEMPTDCESIKSRHYFPEEPRNDDEAAYPYAVARNVFRVILSAD